MLPESEMITEAQVSHKQDNIKILQLLGKWQPDSKTHKKTPIMESCEELIASLGCLGFIEYESDWNNTARILYTD